ncbi:probable receptor-like protein kinase At2g23200 isoform X1 [Diospyros lotus]|uniref:probable receptor-like protein kinase At2g23200 isoform X1 n=1 Tax=Diospyros lotus TaxID=55363 RepID=UPI00225A5F7B|nr:probable receptor-like protein kinase At2g23200 isoform X1 [Diospyros lotus]XP_052195304.1 probable receptor-like protein kinase At2g23200 isoform X1 [Diospyros lotus]
MAMAKLRCPKPELRFSVCLLLLLLLLLPQLSLLSSTYTAPDKYFINCGSDSNVTAGGGRIFVGDEKPGSLALSTGKSSSVNDASSSSAASPLLYQTARIFTTPSSYDLEIDQNGTYMVRLHFYPFSSRKNLFDAQFSVSASRFPLLSNFSVRNTSTSPVIKEFLLPNISAGKFRIYFTPQEPPLAFVNAIEVFVAPDDFIPDSATHVTASGGNSKLGGLLSHAFHPVHRINVGGEILTADNDTLWRNWVPDDEYLFSSEAAKNSRRSDPPNYQDGRADKYDAPDLVYNTAKEMNTSSDRDYDFFNITWRFGVDKNARHLVRVHFCDIISKSVNDTQFNLYVYSNFSKVIDPYEEIGHLAAPFYYDLVVESDNSGIMNISVGPRNGTHVQTAFLNGLEIMELIQESGSVPDENESSKNYLLVIVGSVVGGVALLISLAVVFLLCFKYRKAKPVEVSDWLAIPLFGGMRSPGESRERTATVSRSPVCNLNLGLKLSFADIQYATNNFDMKLLIGEGGFGKVYKGTLRSGIKVAVKRSQPGHGQGFPEFQTEITVLSKIRHRHLVSLIGYCDERSEMILVYEFMERGTLRDHLYGSNRDNEKSTVSFELSWIRRLEICIGAAKGLHYLHSSSDICIIHRDVKSTNILLDFHFVAKVSDFGISRLGPLDQTHVSTVVKGTFGYLDPEYFRCLQLTKKSDVFSFGVVLLEVLCARRPISNLLPAEEINLAEWGLSWHKKGELEKIIDPLLVGKINPNSLRMFGGIVEKCLREYGVDRPSMHDVLWDLEYALQLQQTARNREPHEDSTPDPSWVLPVPAFAHLPSESISISNDEIPMAGFSDSSHPSASEVFSLIKIDEAR